MSEEKDEMLKECRKEMASVYRAEHFSPKQTEEYWKKRAKENEN